MGRKVQNQLCEVISTSTTILELIENGAAIFQLIISLVCNSNFKNCYNGTKLHDHFLNFCFDYKKPFTNIKLDSARWLVIFWCLEQLE